MTKPRIVRDVRTRKFLEIRETACDYCDETVIVAQYAGSVVLFEPEDQPVLFDMEKDVAFERAHVSHKCQGYLQSLMEGEGLCFN